MRATATEALLIGQAPTQEVLRHAAEAAVEGIEPWDELRGSAAYKLEVLPAVAARALERALERTRPSATNGARGSA